MSDFRLRVRVVFQYTLGIVICILAVQTFLHTMDQNLLEHEAYLTVLIAGVEAVAALFFLIPYTKRMGGYVLICALAFAFIYHALHGDLNWPLLVYFTGVLLVVT